MVVFSIFGHFSCTLNLNLTDIELTIESYKWFRPTFHIRLVTFKNIDIRLSHGPKTNKFSGQTRVWASHLGPFRKEKYPRVQETTHVPQSLFWDDQRISLFFGHKMAWPPCGHRETLRVGEATKSLDPGPSFFVSCYLEIKLHTN